jgi:3'-phosphoadenosine 5'-phosphosulfate sulfotransferase (PAPS reductase)/FAD synthetase
VNVTLSHLSRLEAESIHIIREVIAEAQNPVMLFSAGKDSTVMAHLAIRAFYPSKPPFPLLHVDSTWEFQSLLEFRDAFAAKHRFDLIAYSNEEGRAAGINPFDHGDKYTSMMRTEPLKTRRNPARRNGSFLCAEKVMSGSRASSDRNYGGSTTRVSAKGNRRGYFHYPIGQKSISGPMRYSKISNSPRFTMRRPVWWLNAAVPSLLSTT